MLDFCMEPMAMVLVWDMLDLDIPVLDMLDMVVMDLAMVVLVILVLVTMARGPLMLSQRLKLMLVFSMEPMAMVPVLDMLVLATMAKGPLMLSQRLMLVCTMEDMDMVLVWD